MPTAAEIPANQASVSFPITAIHDGLVTGDKTITTTAQVTTVSGQVLSQGSASGSLTITEADGAALALTLANSSIAKGATTTATISGNTPTDTDLVVTLTSRDTTHATVPATVTIPAGQRSATFTVTGIDNHVQDGIQNVSILATAPGFATGVQNLIVTDVDLADLQASSVIAPTTGLTDSTVQVTWTVTNTGLYAANGSWNDEIFLDPIGLTGPSLATLAINTTPSTSGTTTSSGTCPCLNVPTPTSDTPWGTVGFTGTLAPGQSYTRTETISLPSVTGQYNVRVVTNPDQTSRCCQRPTTRPLPASR